MMWISHILLGTLGVIGLTKTTSLSAISLIIAGCVAPDVIEFKHRTIGHSLFLWLPVMLFLPFLSYGAISHIILDAFSKMGVYPLYPIKKKVAFKLYKTGSAVEYFLDFCAICTAVVMTL